MQFEFGSGAMYGTKINDDGTTGATSVFGILQGGSVDFTATNKQLFGTYQFPVAVGRGTAKISGKATFAQIYAQVYNDLFFRGTVASGQTLISIDEACLVGTPHTTRTTVVAPPSSGTWSADMIVKDKNGTQMTVTTGTPTAGQYSVSAGTYTFATVDANTADGTTVTITYEYTITTGQAITITNPLLGTAPAFTLRLQQTYLGQSLHMKLNRVISSKLTFATKLEDFQIPEMDFDAFADNTNQIGHLYLAA